MDESVSTVERETVQQHSSAKPRVEARVEEALKRLAELRKGMPPIDAVKLVREGREMPERDSRQ